MAWTYRCAAPVGDGKCGQVLTNAVCDPMEGPSVGAFRTLVAGPTITHLPCGHEWWRGEGWEPRVEQVPWAAQANGTAASSSR